ncbi:flagellar hook assembly protein FlgD [Sphaerotilus microaerophilus]|jgi:flagellar basal-body rod modification protein FlgD|uniref:Basal-body rod modification protein FlgD n=1 Tax=Sphaerotilus microaerophilus TaxID=2914710 RepID=A0ABM7YQE5_9BURK|nr:flagellar hook capping FlgD N-terminal domain-containing protein [Sphaerotilus sp. FB-5]BDI06776.1 basal-body rod modification protein FlgD [Sphaerotilus sp. FB-5]
MSTTSVSGSSDAASLYQQLNGSSTTQSATSEAADRFLKLLVTQMKNQDPLSPMDNAQVTSQMAQINTVSGIEKVNESIQSMTSQFLQMQALQSASLVGKGVLVSGNALAVEEGTGTGQAAFDLSGAADSVKVEVLNGAGRVVDTLDLGAETSGRHAFEWTAPEGLADTTGLRFRVVATRGTQTVTATPLMRDAVQSVSTSGSTLTLQLAGGGSVAYSDVKAFSN